MALPDTNTIIRAYLAANAGVIALVGTRIFSPRLPENTALPAISFFTRGGTSSPYIPDIVTPSVQFDCWAANPIGAREVYIALYNALQGIQDTKVTIGATDYYILGAQEEVQGQDLIDIDIPGFWRVLTFFSIMIK